MPMLIRRCDPAQAQDVTMDGVTGVAMQMLVGRDDAAPNFAMRHFVVQPGGHTPQHSHPWEHEVFVVEGQLCVECNDEQHVISAGDAIFVPSDSMHQFTNESNQPARFLCLVPLEFECGCDVPGS